MLKCYGKAHAKVPNDFYITAMQCSQLDQLVKTSITRRSCAVVITRPPEIIVCFKIVLGDKDLYVIFDSHPRQQHPKGAAFIFNTSLGKTALYLAELLPYDPRLLEDSNSDSGRLQWEAQLLGNVSGHFFECAYADMTMSPDATNAMFEANFELLRLRRQEKGMRAKMAALAMEMEQLRMDRLEKSTERIRERIRDMAIRNGLHARNVKLFGLRSMSPDVKVLPPVPYTGGRLELISRLNETKIPGSYPPDGKSEYDPNTSSRTPSPLSSLASPRSQESFVPTDHGISVKHSTADGDDESEDDFTLAIRVQAKFEEEDMMLRHQLQALQRQQETQSTFNCCICMDELPTDYIARVDACGHSFCRECLRQYVTSGLEDRRYPLLCPECGPTSGEEEIGCKSFMLIVNLTNRTFTMYLHQLYQKI